MTLCAYRVFSSQFVYLFFIYVIDIICISPPLPITAFIACCSVHTPSSNPNKPPPRHLSLPRNMSRRNNRNASAPPPDSSGYQLQGAPDDPPGYNTALREKNEQGYEMR